MAWIVVILNGFIMESLNVDVTDHGAVVHDAIDVDGVIEEDNYGVDPLEEVLGDLHTTEQARHDEETKDGDSEPHEQDSFFQNNHEGGKALVLSGLYQIFKVLLYGKASSYEVFV
jgi:hypothetical protein